MFKCGIVGTVFGAVLALFTHNNVGHYALIGFLIGLAFGFLFQPRRKSVPSRPIHREPPTASLVGANPRNEPPQLSARASQH